VAWRWIHELVQSSADGALVVTARRYHREVADERTGGDEADRAGITITNFGQMSDTRVYQATDAPPAASKPDRSFWRHPLVVPIVSGIVLLVAGSVLAIVEANDGSKDPTSETSKDNSASPAAIEGSDPLDVGPTLVVADLRAGVQLSKFDEVLGTPATHAAVGSLDEYIYADEQWFVQAVVDSSDKVVMFSVTTRSPEFAPRVGACGSTDVELGKSTFADLGDQPWGMIGNYHSMWWNEYSEIYGGVGACDYKYSVFSYNSIWSAEGSDVSDVYDFLGPIGDKFVGGFEAGPGSLGEQQHEMFVDGDVVRSSPGFDTVRPSLRINTYSETLPDFDFFVTYPEVVAIDAQLNFGPGPVDARTFG